MSVRATATRKRLSGLRVGLNWCIATSAHRYLMLHAGSVAFGDRALILPGTRVPASKHAVGCVGCVARLLSDEFGIIRPGAVTCCRCRAEIR